MGYADEVFDLRDRVVLVTGGSRGLGREIAFGAARCGADVVIASRTLERCEATAAEIAEATGRVAMPYAVHVGRWDQLDGLVDAVYERFGKVYVLVNNAGMSPLYESLTWVSEKLFDAVFNLNIMTEGLAKAYGPTVRVNTLMAGPFLTDISKAWDFGGVENPFGHLALQRAGDPAEIVGAALFLMSDASSFTTGSIVRADGGLP